MCGICGIAGDAPPWTLEAMVCVMRHSGPDASNIGREDLFPAEDMDFRLRAAAFRLSPLRGELDEARRLLYARERELDAIRGTWSWKVTAPLREVKRILSRRKAGEP